MPNENYDPAISAAQHLANLMEQEVAGYKPKSKNDDEIEMIINELISGTRKLRKVNLDEELKKRRPIFAPFVVLSALIKSTPNDLFSIRNEVSKELFGKKSPARLIFELIDKQLCDTNAISISEAQKEIDDFVVQFYGSSSSGRMRLSVYYWWFHLLNIRPTKAQINDAIRILNEGVFEY